MTPKEIMKPRWKIIAAIPFKEEDDFWKVGEILDRDWGWHGDDEDGFKYHISDYPHLFKKLEWWEGRQPEEMPLYVKWESGKVTQVIRWNEGCDFCKVIDHTYFVSSHFFTPATREEYEQYKQKEATNE